MSKIKKSVSFVDKPSIIHYTKPENELILNVRLITDRIVHFLRDNVGHIMSYDIASIRSLTARALKGLSDKIKITPEVVESVATFLDKNKLKRISLVIQDAVVSQDMMQLYAAITLIRVGLKSFLDYNHCVNKCHRTAKYGETDFTVKIKDYGKQFGKLKDACFDAHQEIEDAIGIDDIRLFDVLLRAASRNKCSLLKSH